MQHYLLLLALLFAPSNGIAGTATDQQHSFWIDCVFNEKTETEKLPEPQKARVLSSPSAQTTIDKQPFGILEIAAVAGVRHFLVPHAGGYLGGTNITVYPDGRSVATQVYDIKGTLSVVSNIGNCEVAN